MAGKTIAKGRNSDSDAVALLKDQIKNRNPGRVYLFYGDEPFLIDYYVDELKKTVLSEETKELNYVVFENKVAAEDIIDSCDTFPVFADKKLVMVKKSLLFSSRKGKDPLKDAGSDDNAEDLPEQDNRDQEALKNYIPLIPETTCLIFVEEQVDKRLGLFRQIQKHGLVIEFKRQDTKELVPWVAKGFRKLGKIISPDAAMYLVSINEPNMYALKNEILKICSYAGERKEITLEDIRLVASPTIKSVIFDLLDAVAQKNAPKALKILDDILQLKEPEQKILAMLSKQTGELIKLKYLLKKGADQQISRYFQGKHPYALKIMLGQARQMDEKYLKKLLKSCMEAESNYKKGLIDARLALELLLTNILN